MPRGPRLINSAVLPVVVVIVAGEAALFWWFPINPMVALLPLSLAPLLFGFWFWLYARSPAYRAALHDHRRDLARADTLHLQEALVDLKAPQGVEQLAMIEQKHADLMSVLKLRFRADELTYVRYAQAADRVYASARDNLREVEVALKSVQSIDPNRLQPKLTDLRKRGDSIDATEVKAVERRLQLYDAQWDKVRSRLAENEAALTALSNTATALADAPTAKDGVPALDTETAIAELEQLAGRAKRYSK